jgi:hypothetical protein
VRHYWAVVERFDFFTMRIFVSVGDCLKKEKLEMRDKTLKMLLGLLDEHGSVEHQQARAELYRRLPHLNGVDEMELWRQRIKLRMAASESM